MHAKPDVNSNSNNTILETTNKETEQSIKRKSRGEAPGWTTIRVRKATKAYLESLADLDESFDSVITSLIEGNEELEKLQQ